MTDQQKAFADEYCKHFNATKAAISAGYSEHTATVKASQLLTLDEIALYIQDKQSIISREAEVDAVWITKRFKTISDRCMQDIPVLDFDGNPIGEYKFDSNGANKATEMLGKMIGAFEKDNTQSRAVIVWEEKKNYNGADNQADGGS